MKPELYAVYVLENPDDKRFKVRLAVVVGRLCYDNDTGEDIDLNKIYYQVGPLPAYNVEETLKQLKEQETENNEQD